MSSDRFDFNARSCRPHLACESIVAEDEDPLILQLRQFCRRPPPRGSALVSRRQGLETLKVVAAVKRAPISGHGTPPGFHAPSFETTRSMARGGGYQGGASVPSMLRQSHDVSPGKSIAPRRYKGLQVLLARPSTTCSRSSGETETVVAPTHTRMRTEPLVD